MSSVRYQSLGPLLAGEGSRAFLGLALEDGASPRPVVLIWAPQDVVQNPELKATLRRETARALVFEHPHILRVHALAEQDGGLARVTEFADGEPLRRLLEAHPACRRTSRRSSWRMPPWVCTTRTSRAMTTARPSCTVTSGPRR
ncbi:hypothetical protein [Myxococcus sp. MxC21-1]|uniref:hypothetical protein n=1 Tax=Myxococcus sp. MxC21-1 TaxID=3041439 RepID=UPI002930A1F7|nr:hypothetical protein [Myxococcus sp. MxC21-1]